MTIILINPISNCRIFLGYNTTSTNILPVNSLNVLVEKDRLLHNSVSPLYGSYTY